MITIITGPVQSGKSTVLLQRYQKTRLGDGFFNVRCYDCEEYIGQDIVQLSTNRRISFSRVDGHIPPGWNERFAYRNYSFSADGISFAEEILRQIRRDRIPGYIDELGPLELAGMGLYTAAKSLIHPDTSESGHPLTIVIRESCLAELIAKLHISKFEVVRMDQTLHHFRQYPNCST